jgi:hypothetical protein
MKIIDYREVEPKELTAATMRGVTGRVLLGKATGCRELLHADDRGGAGGLIPPHKHPWEHEQFVHAGQGRILRDGQGWRSDRAACC